MLFTRIELPEIVEMPIQPCIVATKDVQLSIVANWKAGDMSRVSIVTPENPPENNRHSQAEWLLRPSGSTGVCGQSSQASVLVSKTRMRLQ